MMLRKFAYIIATGFGSGYAPLIPGTAGSLLALIIYIFIPYGSLFWLAVIIVTFFTGVWSAGVVESDRGKDAGLIVIDEFTGQWISLIFLPANIYIYLSSFILFRILDIVKPFPANKSQELPGGWGVMTDDVIAGIYTNIVLQIILLISGGL